ncbi:hypothetical protein FRD01_07175 [Microvenator marinus]|uniref:Uncharacterized protein n=1 Tax=Microvenator marinus TaxID=2600177 RepID=A0A5B8XNH5_9DELT|nr:hypothetical protein [Microvenator marinus]QED27025.1 hypothetical protein FRD01_07175 [Microvenator marinus]
MSKRKWASDDDAGDLLAGILDETEMDARAEEERIQREIQAREEEERRRKAQEEERKRQEAEARISAELERQSLNAERRTQKMQALKIEELKERGEWVDPEIEATKQREEEARRQRELEEQAMAEARKAAAQARVASEAQPNQPTVAANNNSAPVKLIAAGFAALLVAGVAIFAIASGGYEPDATPYSKVVYSPKTVQVAMVERGFTLIPKAEPEAEVEEEPKRTSRRSTRSASTSRPKATSAPKAKTDAVGRKANKKASELEKLLESADDPFAL